MKKIFSVVFVLLFIAVSASAQDVCTRDSFFPNAGNCGYDVQDYQMDMTWNLEGDHWAVSEVLTFISEWDTDELKFDFTDQYEIESLSIDGRAADYSLQDNKLTVHYGFAHDTEYKLYAAFSGKLFWGELFDESGEGRTPEDGFCMINEPTNAWRFYICNDHPKDKATYHYSFTVPVNYVPAGSGRLLMMKEANETIILPGKSYVRDWNPEASAEDGTVTFTYAQEAQTAPYLFTVCAGEFDMKLQTLPDGKVQLDFVDHGHEDTNHAWELTTLQEEIIKALSEFFGPYPYEDSGAIVFRPHMSGALETQGRSLYDADTTEDYVFAHEITHQWMGDLISLEDWSDLWLKEGAASYGEALWKEYSDGKEAYSDYMKKDYEIAIFGSHKIDPLDDEMIKMLYTYDEGANDALYDHEMAVKAAASLCMMDTDRITMKAGDVTFEEWIEGLTGNCDQVRMGPVSEYYLGQMTGRETEDIMKTKPGPKEISFENYEQLYGAVNYKGGAVLYHSLRYKLGDEIFKKVLQTLIEENKWGNVNEAKFIDVFNRVSGEDLTDFIKSYLYYAELGHIPDLLGLETYEEAVEKYVVK